MMKQQMKAVAKKEVKTHEKKMHGMKCGGKVKKYAAGGKVMEDKAPSAAQAKEMRGQMQDAKNQKAWDDYQKSKKPNKTVKKMSKGGGIERKGKSKGKLI